MGVSSATSYGIVGVVVLLVTCLYFGGLVLLVGASVNAVLAGRSEDVEDIAWDAALAGDASANDADFVAAVEALRAALDGRTEPPNTEGTGPPDTPNSG